MAEDPIVTNGIPINGAPTGPVPLRREIRSLQRDFPDQWTLYILGLKDFQEVDENDLLSYYQIAGIHGLPFKSWNGVEGDQVTGYCTHSSILFPTWHRPYLALFEEVLYSHVLRIASAFPENQGRARYVAAARDFRMPYWDWGLVLPRGQSVVPTSLSSRTIAVVTPQSNARLTTIDNPLYSYRFHPVNPSPDDFPDNTVATWQTTVRWPRRQTSESQNDLISRSIEITNQNTSSNLRERLTLLVTRYRDYGPFSNQAWLQGQPGQYGSIEGVHDTLHTAIGGQGERRNDFPGHMSMVPYAAFDPAFWLHHTNIDRLCAMWQAINPNTFVTGQAASQDTVTTAEGTIENVRTPLTPFWKNTTEFYTSTDVRRTERFGNAYLETQPWNFQSTRDYQASVRTAFRNLYGGSNLAFILASAQGGALSTGPQMQLPQASQSASGLQRPLQVSAMALPSVKHGQDSKQIPLGGSGHPGDSKQIPLGGSGHPGDSKQIPLRGSGHPGDSKGHDNPKDGKVPQNIKDTGKKTESPHPDVKHHARDLKDLAPHGKYLEWITNLKVQKHGLDGTFFVHVFLGEFNRENPLAWRSDPNLVGTFSVLGESVGTGCKKCKKDREDRLQITGQVPLTLALAERYLTGQIDNLTPEKVVPYLQTNLHWRVAAASGIEWARGEVPDLVVSVISNEVTVPTADDEFPVYSEHVQVHPECTTGRDGEGRGEGTGLIDPNQT